MKMNWGIFHSFSFSGSFSSSAEIIHFLKVWENLLMPPRGHRTFFGQYFLDNFFLYGY